MTKYVPGAENKRLTEFNTYCPVKIFLIDLKNNDEIVAEFEIDYANETDRKRLGRITYWAITNEHSVETMNRKDIEPPYVKD